LLMFAVNKTPPRRRECSGPAAPTPRAFSSMQQRFRIDSFHRNGRRHVEKFVSEEFSYKQKIE